MSETNSILPPHGWVTERVMRRAVWPENPYFYSSMALRQQCQRGQFPHLKLSNRYYFKIADVFEFLRRQSTSVEEATAARPPHGNFKNKHAVGRAEPGRGKAQALEATI
jgi:hypothetical protein